MLAPAPPIEAGAAEPSWSSSAARCWWPTTRPYDVGFLKAACARHGYRWPNPRVLDTAALARRVLTRDEVPNRKLGTLAALLPHRRPAHPPGAGRRPGHGRRAARADRAAGQHRVDTLGDADRVRPGGHPDPAPQAAPGRRAARRARASTSSGPPTTGRSTSARPATSPPGCAATSPPAEKRARISEMLAAAERVEAVECAHSLEAEVRELRLIAAHAPPYNRRSKYPGAGGLAQADRRGRTRGCRWSARLGRRRTPPTSGPFASRRAAELAAAGVHDALPLRQCTPPAVRCAPPRRPARWPSWAAARRPASTGSPPRSTHDRGRRAVPHRHRRRPAAGGRRAAGPDRRARRATSATRRRRWCGPGWPRCCGPPSGCSGWPR